MINRVILFILLVSPCIIGATLQGTVYNLDLDPAKNTILTINTTPKQQVITSDGSYTLNIPIGTYVLDAYGEGGYVAEENITIVDNGTYTLDLFLFVDEQDETMFPPDDLGINDTSNTLEIASVVIGALLVCGGLFLFFRSKKQNVSKDTHAILTPDSDKVLHTIKKLGGTTTQKEIRKALGMSEAKVSLLITDLESQGRIRKIRKGRDNVIVINEP